MSNFPPPRRRPESKGNRVIRGKQDSGNRGVNRRFSQGDVHLSFQSTSGSEGKGRSSRLTHSLSVDFILHDPRVRPLALFQLSVIHSSLLVSRPASSVAGTTCLHPFRFPSVPQMSTRFLHREHPSEHRTHRTPNDTKRKMPSSKTYPKSDQAKHLSSTLLALCQVPTNHTVEFRESATTTTLSHFAVDLRLVATAIMGAIGSMIPNTSTTSSWQTKHMLVLSMKR